MYLLTQKKPLRSDDKDFHSSIPSQKIVSPPFLGALLQKKTKSPLAKKAKTSLAM